MVTVSRYALGVASLVLACGSLALVAVTLRRRFVPELSGPVAWLACWVIGFAVLITLLEVLGAVGLFRLVPIVLACLVVAACVRFTAGASEDWPPRVAPRPGFGGISGARWAPWAAIAVAAVLVAEWAGPTLQSYDHGIRSFDSVWYHLPWAASFAQTGQITSLRFTDVEYLTAFYPATAELLHGLGMVLLGRDTLSPVLNLLWLGLVLLAAWCVGDRYGRGFGALLGAALALATPAVTLSQAGSAANDVVGVFFVIAAVALVANADGARAPLVLAAISGGLAVATKLSMLAPVLALTVGVLAIERRIAWRWLVALALAGGFWYLRNLIAVGNPLPWLSIPGLATPAAPLQAHTGFAVIHYATDTGVWSRVFVPGLRSGLGNWWPLTLIAAIVAPIMCLLRGADRTLRMLALVALTSVVAYVLTPETAAGPAGDPAGFAFNLRYAAPALVLCLTLVPLAPAFAGRRARFAVLVFLTALLVATLAWGELWPARHLAGAIAVGVGFALVSAAILAAPSLSLSLSRSRSRSRSSALARPLLVAGSLAVALALAIGGYAWERHYLRGRYAFNPGVSYLSRVWAMFRTIHHARVGIVGTFGGFFAYPLYGLDGSNSVQYIAQRSANGSFTPISTCASWRTAVSAGRYRYIVTTPARDPWKPKRLTPSPEGSWTSSDPAARLIYSRIADRQRIEVFELTAPLDPAACG